MQQFFKNEYLFQMQIVLVKMLSQTYIFMIKKIVRGFDILTRKNKICYVSLPIPYIRPTLSRGHQTVQ